MEREEIIGNVTTIGKVLICAFGTPSMVSFVTSNEYVIFMGALFGLIWAFYDSKYFNTFFNRNRKDPIPESEVLNPEYECECDEY